MHDGAGRSHGHSRLRLSEETANLRWARAVVIPIAILNHTSGPVGYVCDERRVEVTHDMEHIC